MRFLVVDDSIDDAPHHHQHAEQTRVPGLLEAANGREGLDRLSTSDVDMVITDWNMPEMNGDRLHPRRARDRRATKTLPVLMVTTNAAKDDIVEALRAGVNSYVVKPFTADTIKEKIEAAITK